MFFFRAIINPSTGELELLTVVEESEESGSETVSWLVHEELEKKWPAVRFKDRYALRMKFLQILVFKSFWTVLKLKAMCKKHWGSHLSHSWGHLILQRYIGNLCTTLSLNGWCLYERYTLIQLERFTSLNSHYLDISKFK